MPSILPVRRNVLHRIVPTQQTVSYTGPIDIYGSAIVAFGLRAMSAAYITGTKHLVDLVDQAGANPITIDCKTDGTFDLASYNSWVSAHTVTTAKVTKLYDQSGNANHMTQATLANMPSVSTSGVLSLALAAGQFMATPVLTFAQPFSCSVVGTRDADTTSGDSNAILQNQADGGGLVYAHSILPNSLVKVVHGGTFSSSNTFVLGTKVAVQYLANGASSLVRLLGVNTTGNPGANGYSGTTMALNTGPTDTLEFTEGGYWSGDKSASFASVETNQRTFWGI